MIRVWWEMKVRIGQERPTAVEAGLLDATVTVVKQQAEVNHGADDTSAGPACGNVTRGTSRLVGLTVLRESCLEDDEVTKRAAVDLVGVTPGSADAGERRSVTSFDP